jgi:two-component system, NtrC family, response regulator HydG
MLFRRSDRRAGLDVLVRQVAADLVMSADRRNLTSLLIRRLGQFASVRSVGIKEVSGVSALRTSQPIRARDYVAYSVPVKDEGRRVMLEASFDARGGPDDWACQLLEGAAYLAAVLMEAERLASTPAPLTVVNRDGAAPLIGCSETMRLLRERVERVANTNFTVLIEGESGVGKELVARQIHELSVRRQGPFVAINCAALVETLLEAELFGIEERTATGVRGRRGKFEHADGGTLFLDEIGEISPAVQVKLLRFLQEREFERVGGNDTISVDVRIIAATNRNLQQRVADGKFREDLFYRLNVINIDMPPLRARASDILLLAGHFLRKFAAENGKTISGFSTESLARLGGYGWPGNVRELENVVERAVILCRGPEITVADLPAHLVPARHGDAIHIPGATLDEVERYTITKTLESTGGSTTRAAEILGISVRKIQYKLHEYQGAPRSARDAIGSDKEN